MPKIRKLQTETRQSKDIDSTKNTIIRGDNLEVLKILQKNYCNKIKVIYIDPPFNTKSKNLIYKDDFKHSYWLSFISKRLKLAKKLLTDDGIIFISIDDNEQANLKILCNKIFGENNFIANFIWQTTKSSQGMQTKNLLVNNCEYILTYAKNFSLFKFAGIVRDKKEFNNPDNDHRGPWKRQYLQRLGQNLSVRKIINPKTNFVYEFETPYTQEKLNEWINTDVIIFSKNDKGYPMRKEFLSEYKNNKQLVTNLGLYATKSYTEKIYKLFDNYKIFTQPKPDDLIKFIIKQSSNKNSIILDFFAGSGTTGDAIMQLNAEDEGERKFILVQCDEILKKNTPAYDFCIKNKLQPTISSICIERLNRAGEKLKIDNKNSIIKNNYLLDIGYKVYTTCI